MALKRRGHSNGVSNIEVLLKIDYLQNGIERRGPKYLVKLYMDVFAKALKGGVQNGTKC